MVGKFRPVFPMIGKIFRHFSNDWKKCFQWLENFSGGRIFGQDLQDGQDFKSIKMRGKTETFLPFGRDGYKDRTLLWRDRTLSYYNVMIFTLIQIPFTAFVDQIFISFQLGDDRINVNCGVSKYKLWIHNRYRHVFPRTKTSRLVNFREVIFGRFHQSFITLPSDVRTTILVAIGTDFKTQFSLFELQVHLALSKIDPMPPRT